MSAAAAQELLDACIFAPEGLPGALEESAHLIGCDYFGLVSADFTQPRFIMSERQGEALRGYFTGGWEEVDYRIRAENRTPLGTLFRDHVDVDNSVRHTSVIYNEFFRPNDMANYAGIRFEIDGASWYCCVARSEAAGGIDGAAADDFLRVAGAAMRSASFAARLDREHAAGILAALEAGRTAALLMDRDGLISHVSSAAADLFDDSFGVRGNRLWATNPETQAGFDQLQQMARSRVIVPAAALKVERQSGSSSLQLQAARISGVGLDQLPGARLLLILSATGVTMWPLAEEARRRFRLTEAETDVVGQFAEGRTIDEIARRRNVAPSTIREQMKKIYTKTGVHRQVDLLRLLEQLKY